MKSLGHILLWSLAAGLLAALIYFVVEKIFGKTDFPIGAAVGGGLAGYSMYRKGQQDKG